MSLGPVPKEGRVAIVTAAGRDAVDADAPITNGDFPRTCEVVWSWHPDAGVKFALRSAGDGGQKARSTGESTE